MKKLLVLSLVMAVAGLANAGMIGLEADGQTVTLVGSGFTAAEGSTCFLVFGLDTAVPTMNYVGTGSLVTDMAPIYGLAAFEGMLGLDAGSLKAAYMIDIKDTTDPFAIPNGVLVTAETIGVGTVYYLDQGGALLGSVFIPEPMTMGLLGLGALFLRRRK